MIYSSGHFVNGSFLQVHRTSHNRHSTFDSFGCRQFFHSSIDRPYSRGINTVGAVCDRATPRSEQFRDSRLPWRDEVDGLPVVAPVDAEVLSVEGEYLTTLVQLGHDNDRRVGQVHSLVARHQKYATSVRTASHVRMGGRICFIKPAAQP